MSIYQYEAAFAAGDRTTPAMRNALKQWQELYYGADASREQDPCQRIGYTVVNKLVRTVFGEYQARCEDPVSDRIIQEMNRVSREAVQLALMLGACFVKPCVSANGFHFALIPRSNVLIFGRNAAGDVTDVGMVERTTDAQYYYTLLERRSVDEAGFLTITNRLYRSRNGQDLGSPVPLAACPVYRELAEEYRYTEPVGSVGLVQMRTPMLNCVDGSADAVAIYAAAAGLIRNIDRNEAQMNGEFSRGQSRIIASADLLARDAAGTLALTGDLFVGLDEDPEQVGLTVFSPSLREQSFLARKQEYLRNVESLIGLKRGLLSKADAEQKTATEIASSAGDFNLTVIDFQRMWQMCLEQTLVLCAQLAKLYRMEVPQDLQVQIDWGNGTLYDEDRTWQDYRQMVLDGMLRPEIALGWRFGLPAEDEQQRQKIRERLMPETAQ